MERNVKNNDTLVCSQKLELKQTIGIYFHSAFRLEHNSNDRQRKFAIEINMTRLAWLGLAWLGLDITATFGAKALHPLGLWCFVSSANVKSVAI